MINPRIAWSCPNGQLNFVVLSLPLPQPPTCSMLIQSVKAGRGYFDMLREESALKKKQQQLQKLEEEERHKFQPAKRMSEIHYGELLLK